MRKSREPNRFAGPGADISAPRGSLSPLARTDQGQPAPIRQSNLTVVELVNFYDSFPLSAGADSPRLHEICILMQVTPDKVRIRIMMVRLVGAFPPH